MTNRLIPWRRWRNPIRALTFDIVGTVFDWYGGFTQQVPPLAQKYGLKIDASAFAAGAIAGYGQGVGSVNAGGPWVAPDDILHAAVATQLAGAGATAPAEVESFFSIWRSLPPWPDVPGGLDALHGRFTLAILSNMSVATETALSAHAGLSFDRMLSAEAVQAYKPNPAVYEMAATALGLEPSQILMVAAHKYDLEAARAQGFRTAFLARPQEAGPGGTADTSPGAGFDYNVTSLPQLAEKLGIPVGRFLPFRFSRLLATNPRGSVRRS